MTSPVAALLTSIIGCVPQYAHVGCCLRFRSPKNPDEPARSSDPTCAHTPDVALQLQNENEPPGYPLPTDTGHKSDVTESPLDRVTANSPVNNRDTQTTPVPPVTVIVQEFLIE